MRDEADRDAYRSVLGGYRLMWMMVMFDLPVTTAQERKIAGQFRLALMDLGFERTQFSVYLRYCASVPHLEAMLGRVRALVPRDGRVGILVFTDKQYARVIHYRGTVQQPPSQPPDQLALF